MNNIAGRLEMVQQLLDMGIMSPEQAAKLLNVNYPFSYVSDELLYFHKDFIVKVLELK